MAVQLLLGVLLASAAHAQTGKLAGTVTDAGGGEALPGANVTLRAEIVGGEAVPLDPLRGTTTDADGEYFLLNVRPGRYVLEASFIGFQRTVKRPILVNSGQTTTVDFALQEETFEGEEVVVTAERSLVQRDLTSSSAKVLGDDIAALPVENFAEVLELQAGVTTDIGGGLHVRGGRSSELKYYIDGIAVSNPFDNSLAVEVENNAIQELEVISGTFNAEYGQAMSGIVSIVTKEGTDEFKGSFSAYAGDFVSDRTDVFYGIDEVDPLAQQYVEGSLSGPLPLGGLTFFASGRYTDQTNWLLGRRVFLPEDVSDFSANDPAAWRVPRSGDSSVVPMNPYESLSGQAKLTWRATSTLKLSYNLMANRTTGKSYNHRFRLNPEALPTGTTTSFNHLLRFEHTLGARAFYTVNASLYRNDLDRHVYDDPLDPRYRVLGPPRQEPNFVLATGSLDPSHFDRSSTTWAARADLTWQVDRYNMLKLGAEARYHELDYRYFEVQVDSSVFGDRDPRVPPTSSILHDTYTRDPLELAFYIQDKIEYEDLIVNVGLRLDYFDARATVPTDLRDPANQLFPRPEEEAYAETESKWQLAPRLGLAFPITERGVFHASYGHFFQIPEFSRLFENPEFEIFGTYGSFLGNADLEAQRTTMYEIGLQQELASFVAADVTAFYRDVRNLLGAELITSYRNDLRFGRYVTDDIGSVRGVTVALQSRVAGTGFSAGLNYTYQVAEGMASNPQQEFIDARAGVDTLRVFVPLDWDLRHTGSTYVNYAGDTWGASFIARLNSGYPFTPTYYRIGSDIEQLRNEGRYNSDFFVDVRAYRRFAFAGVRPELFVAVENVLDFARRDRFPEIDPPTEEAYQRLGLDRINTIREYLLSPAVQPTPREVKLGVRVTF